MRHSRTLPAVTVFSAFALVMAGCSSPGDGAEDAADKVSIASVLGIDDGSEWDSESYREQEEQIQDAIATCMAEQGWEYIPVVYPDNYYEFSDEDQLEMIEREGLGVTYWTLNQGNDDAMMNDPMADFEDPNWAITESLSEGELTAYYEALHGTDEENEAMMQVEIDPETGEEMYYSEGWGPGCWGEASEAVYGDDPWQDEDLAEAMDKFYTELYERVESDPRMIALEEEWLECMTAAGYDYKDQEDFWNTSYTDIQERHDAIVGEDFYADPFEGWSDSEIDDFFTNATDEEIDALYGGPAELTDTQRTQLEELLAEEIELATAEYNCSKDMYTESDKIYQEVEAAYTEENRAELEQLAAQFGSEE